MAKLQNHCVYVERDKLILTFLSPLYSCHGIENRHAAKHEKRPSQKLETSWPFSL